MMTTSAGALSDLGALRVDPLILWRPRRRADWFAQAICVSVAVAIHVGVLAAFVFKPPPEESYGAGGQSFEAIEIELVQSSVLESSQTKPLEQTAAADPGEVTEHEGEQAPQEAQQQDESPKPKPEDMETRVEANEPEAKPPPPEEEKSTPPQSQGGTTAVGVDGSVPASGPAAASAGAMSRYAAEVRRALAKNTPNGRGHRGSVTIKFTISQVGKISAAEITVSSGNEALDQIALSAVQRTAFLRPPPGMSERDLTYMIPFRFQSK